MVSHRFLIIFSLIEILGAMSDQEDLRINEFVRSGCLKIREENEFFFRTIQIDHFQSYQIFSSSEMSVELCFRLCRQSIVFLLNNQSQCLCFYVSTTNFGEILPIDRCSENDAEMFSLTTNSNLLPSLISADDWAVDGCYYLQNIEQIRPNYWLYALTTSQALDFCRKHCEKLTQQGSYSFALSARKSCYCLPILFRPMSTIEILRKPLSHCSFVRSLCFNSIDQCETLVSKVHLETFVKVDVQRFCSSIDSLEFRYDRTLKMCFQSLIFTRTTTFSQLVQRHQCLPLFIESENHWEKVFQRFKSIETSSIVWIDSSSVKNLQQSVFIEKIKSIDLNSICFFIRPSSSSIEILSCHDAPVGISTFCFHRSFNKTLPFKSDFPPIKIGENLVDTNELTCPDAFVLFNRLCYFVDTSFIYNRALAEDLCSAQFENSSLVEFNSHEPFNVNTTQYLGRTIDDNLLEFFYYRLERQFHYQINSTGKKHWLRLLLGERNDKTKCVLRYFTRSTGAFSTLHQCFNGGHPVCQCEPIRKSEKTKKKDENISTSTSTSTTRIIDLVADEDLHNETTIDLFTWSPTDLNTTSTIDEIVTTEKQRSIFSRYRNLIVILTGPVLALGILFGGIIGLVIYLRSDGVTVMHHNGILTDSQRRTKRSSTILTSNSDGPTASPSVVFIRSRAILLDEEEEESKLLHLLDEHLPREDHCQILSPSIIDIDMSSDDKTHLLPDRSSSKDI